MTTNPLIKKAIREFDKNFGDWDSNHCNVGKRKVKHFLITQLEEMEKKMNKRIIEEYRYYKKSGLLIDFLVYLGLVEKEPPPKTVTFMGYKYILKEEIG
jgi:hypothetical protein